MKPEDALKAIEVLKKDWDELPNFLKYCYITSVFGLVVAWLYRGIWVRFVFHKHIVITTIPKLDLLFIILLIVAVPLAYLLVMRLKILYYRHQYPIKNIGIDYHYRVEGDAVQIIDNKRKVIRWVETSKTAYDLGYYQSIWSEMIQRKNYIMSNKTTNLDDFSLKKGIRTRGKPGQ